MFEIFQSLLIVMTLFLNFYILGTSRTYSLIRALMFQGGMTAFAVVLFTPAAFRDRCWLFVGIILLGHTVIFPFLMNRAMRFSNISTALKPMIGSVPSLMIGAGALSLIFWITGKIDFPSFVTPFPGIVQVAVFTLFVGLFLLGTRFMAFTQVVGFLSFSNGIVLLGVALNFIQFGLLEILILLNLLGIVLISGIILFRISLSFDTILEKEDKK